MYHGYYQYALNDQQVTTSAQLLLVITIMREGRTRQTKGRITFLYVHDYYWSS